MFSRKQQPKDCAQDSVYYRLFFISVSGVISFLGGGDCKRGAEIKGNS